MTTATAIEECFKCHEVFASLDEVFSHGCSVVLPRRFVSVPNGFGGTTTIRRPVDTPQGQTPAKTTRPNQYAGTCRKCGQHVDAQAGLLGPKVDGRWTVEHSTCPEAAPVAPVVEPKAKPMAAMPEVPEGHYALRTDDGTVKFYRVERPTEGKWAGWTFVKAQASDDYWPIKGEARRPILEAIALDPQASSALYGHELGVCGVCNRTLTDEDSRARGIGPVCASKMGW